MSSKVFTSWGRVLREAHEVVGLASRHQPLALPASGVSVLPFGNGRSYGDSNLNPGGAWANWAQIVQR